MPLRVLRSQQLQITVIQFTESELQRSEPGSACFHADARPIPQQAIIRGDTKSASITAASILAKVSRDALMQTLDMRHPGYGFADPKGYPVRAHYAALSRLGACAAHRLSFDPVREVLGLPPLPPWPLPSERSGREASVLRAGNT